jgi:regulator of protease activity HflC (stomatin/prohibitin superfamily)
LRLPEDIVAGINRALEADQSAKQAENKVRQVTAEAAQRLVSAEGSASAARLQAQGEADAIRIRAAAEADANAIIRASANALVLAYRQLEKWDGKLPMYAGSALPMMTIDVSKVPEMSEAERRRVLEETIERRAGVVPMSSAAPSASPPPAPPSAPPPRPAALPPPAP